MSAAISFQASLNGISREANAPARVAAPSTARDANGAPLTFVRPLQSVPSSASRRTPLPLTTAAPVDEVAAPSLVRPTQSIPTPSVIPREQSRLVGGGGATSAERVTVVAPSGSTTVVGGRTIVSQRPPTAAPQTTVVIEPRVNEDVRQLEAQLLEANNLIRDAESRNDVLTEQLRVQRLQSNQLLDQLNRRSTTRRGTDEQVARLQADIAILEEGARDARRIATENDATITSLNRRIQSLEADQRTQIATRTALSKQYESEITAFRNKQSEQAAIIASLRNQLATSSDLATTSSADERLRIERDEIRNRMATLNAKFETLQRELQDAVDERDAVVSQKDATIQNLRGEIAVLQSTVNEDDATIGALEDELVQRETQVPSNTVRTRSQTLQSQVPATRPVSAIARTGSTSAVPVAPSTRQVTSERTPATPAVATEARPSMFRSLSQMFFGTPTSQLNASGVAVSQPAATVVPVSPPSSVSSSASSSSTATMIALEEPVTQVRPRTSPPSSAVVPVESRAPEDNSGRISSRLRQRQPSMAPSTQNAPTTQVVPTATPSTRPAPSSRQPTTVAALQPTDIPILPNRNTPASNRGIILRSDVLSTLDAHWVALGDIVREYKSSLLQSQQDALSRVRNVDVRMSPLFLLNNWVAISNELDAMIDNDSRSAVDIGTNTSYLSLKDIISLYSPKSTQQARLDDAEDWITLVNDQYQKILSLETCTTMADLLNNLPPSANRTQQSLVSAMTWTDVIEKLAIPQGVNDLTNMWRDLIRIATIRGQPLGNGVTEDALPKGRTMLEVLVQLLTGKIPRPRTEITPQDRALVYNFLQTFDFTPPGWLTQNASQNRLEC